MKKLYLVTMDEAVKLLRATKVIKKHYIDENGMAKKVAGFSEDPTYPEFIQCIKNLIDFLESATKNKDKADILIPNEHVRMVETIMEVGKHMMASRKLEELKDDLMNMI